MAGATPIYSLPYPEPSDLVANYPALGQDLAEDLDGILASKLDLAGGKILQIVRATDATNRSTTSTSFVDANISVTITPQKSNSIVLVLWTFAVEHYTTSNYTSLAITDASNNTLSGAELANFGSSGINQLQLASALIGYATPATTSAVTYKGRFKNVASGTAALINQQITGQMYAIEVSA